MSRREENMRSAVRTRKTRAHNLRLVRTFAFVILLVVAFWGGFAIRGQSEFLQSLGFSSFVTGLSDKTATESKDATNSISYRVAEVEDILDESSLDEYDLDELTQTALGGFSNAAGDSYLRYYTQARYESLLKSSQTGYAGIGVLFSESNGTAYVVDVFEGSSAQLNDVREGDVVVAIDGDRTQSWSMSEVTASLNRAEGSTAVITWRRPDATAASGGTEFTTTLECKTYNVTNVTTELDGTVGYIKIAQFTQSCSENVRAALNDLLSQGATSFVLDVRDNPGGYLTQAVEIASLFVKSGTEVVTVKTKSSETPKNASSTTVAETEPLVILANSNTAAAAEVLVAALKEQRSNVEVVGATTSGRGSVQVTQELSFGGAIRYTAAYYITPNGHAIDKVGVSPTYAITASDSDTDNQKSYAMEVARSLIAE